MTQHKRKKIRWSGVALLATFVVVVLFLLYMLLSWIGGVVSGWLHASQPAEKNDSTCIVEVVDPAMLRCDTVVAGKLDSLVHHQLHLDSTQMALSVFDITTGKDVYGFRSHAFLIPASCMKLPTAIAALKLLGEDYQYRMSLQTNGKMKGDTLVGTLLLQSEDNPLITSLSPLVQQLRARGVRAVRGHVVVNMLREDTLNSHPSTKTWDITWAKTPLLVRGKSYVKRQLLGCMRLAGIAYKEDDDVKVARIPKLSGTKFTESGQSSHSSETSKSGKASSSTSGGWRIIAEDRTPLKDVLTPMLIHSSNIKAECVFYHLDKHEGIIRDRRMHWPRHHAVERFWRSVWADSTHDVLRGAHMTDGSGLSPENRMTASILVKMLLYAWTQPSLRKYLLDEGLATPGDTERHGSLTTRMSHQRFRGRVFVKTGTMVTQGASSLAGYIHATDDHWYAFCIINPNAPVAESRIFQDSFCKILCK